jgi:hypothetical protein
MEFDVIEIMKVFQTVDVFSIRGKRDMMVLVIHEADFERPTDTGIHNCATPSISRPT